MARPVGFHDSICWVNASLDGRQGFRRSVVYRAVRLQRRHIFITAVSIISLTEYAMSVVSVRISKELKGRMSKLQEDWPSYLRRMIEHRIRQHERIEASKVIDSIRAKTEKGRYNAARTIREDRDRK